MAWTNQIVQETLELLRKTGSSELPWSGAPVQNLDSTQIEVLSRQGNFCQDWSQVKVSRDFIPEAVGGCRFSGKVVLGRVEVFFSSLEDCSLDDGVKVSHCSLLRAVKVGPGAVLIDLVLDCSGQTQWGLDGYFQAGQETPGREVPLCSQGSLQDFIAQVNAGPTAPPGLEDLSAEFSVVGPGCRLEGGRFDQVFFSQSVRALGSSEVSNSTVIGSPQEPVELGAGAVVRGSVVQWGVRIDTHAQVHSSQLLDHSGAERGALITHSLLGPNTEVGEGEVTASFVGPFVGMHHHSLLIAAYWPQGGGNIGYGANVGSNHTGRLADQQICCGEGLFFGLGVNIKFPGNFQGSPYSLVATGLTLSPQKLDLPFSLLVPGPGGAHVRVIPGWALGENLYSLYRNRAKYRARNKSSQSFILPDPFREEIVEKVWITWENLGELQGKLNYDRKDFKGLGACVLSESDRVSGILAYEWLLKAWSLEEFFTSRFEKRTPASLALRVMGRLFPGSDLVKPDFSRLIPDFLGVLQEKIDKMTASLEKDQIRGESVIPGYRDTHPGISGDTVVGQARGEKIIWEERLSGLTK